MPNVLKRISTSNVVLEHLEEFSSFYCKHIGNTTCDQILIHLIVSEPIFRRTFPSCVPVHADVKMYAGRREYFCRNISISERIGGSAGSEDNAHY